MAIMICSCKKPCDCGELTFNEEVGKWLTINDQKIYDGNCESKYDDGSLKERKAFKVGEPFGTWTVFYSDGNPMFQEIYQGGDLYESKEFDGDGHLLKIMRTPLPDKYSMVRQWYDNGQAKYIYVNSHFSNQLLADTLIGWFKDGTKAFEFVSNGETPMEQFPGIKNPIDFKNCLNYPEYLDNAKGMAYYQNGDWMVQAFFENEKIINYNGQEVSVKLVSKHELFTKDNPFINKIVLFNGNDLKIFGEYRTIEEAISSYEDYWNKQKAFIEEENYEIVSD